MRAMPTAGFPSLSRLAARADLAEEGRDFLQKIYDRVGGRYFDIANVHVYPYTYELDRPEPMTALQDALDEARSVMAANGDQDKPIWITEIGFSTKLFPEDYAGEPDVAIATWLKKVYRQLSGAEAIFWYLFEDESRDENPAGRFGLVEYDGTPKPSYDEYGALTAR